MACRHTGLSGRRVHFAAAKRHCALYGAGIDRVSHELGDFEDPEGTCSSHSIGRFRMIWCASWC
jgi:hypothetical protein